MKCSKCESSRLLELSAKSSDLNHIEYNDVDYNGYVPSEINIGDGDYIEITICMSCGHVQGNWPVLDEEVIESLKRM